MATPDPEIVWQRIRAHEGEEFHQIRGQGFTYVIEGRAIRPSTTNRLIPRSAFDEAITLVPLSNTVPVQHLQGPSYLYAVLMDRRIRGENW